MNIKARELEDQRTSGLRIFGWLMAGLLIGTFLTLLFEPRQGRRRRIYLRDKTRHFIRESRWLGAKKARNLRNRAKGLPFKVSKTLYHGVETDDSVLVERVRSVMGRKLTHPKSVHVEANAGMVTLSGQILSREVEEVVRAVKRVPGVMRVVNQLYVHESAEHVSGLQGAGKTYLQ